jgi:hypothetical protein
MLHDCLLNSHDRNIHEVSIMIFATRESLDAFRHSGFDLLHQLLLLSTPQLCRYDNHRVPFLVVSALLYEETGICYDWVLTAFLPYCELMSRFKLFSRMQNWR